MQGSRLDWKFQSLGNRPQMLCLSPQNLETTWRARAALSRGGHVIVTVEEAREGAKYRSLGEWRGGEVSKKLPEAYV